MFHQLVAMDIIIFTGEVTNLDFHIEIVGKVLIHDFDILPHDNYLMMVTIKAVTSN